MNDPKRAEIKARIAAAQARENERREMSLGEKIEGGAIEAKDKFTAFAKEHPVATVAGGVALGVLIAGMFKGPRRAAAQTGAKAAGLAAIGSEIALGFASQLMEGAADLGRDGARKLDDLGDSVGDTARSLRREAGYRAGNAGDAARIARREAGKSIARAFKRH